MQADTKREWMLIVEDNGDIWTILKILLPRAFPQMHFLHTADEPAALTYLYGNGPPGYALPRLVLQDFCVPDRVTGFRLIAAFKQAGSAYQRVPLVVMSASADPEDIQDILQAGADSFFAKPFRTDEWLTALQPLQTYWQP